MKILDIPQSGKRGLNVSQNGRFGQISRTLVIPTNPQTDSQMEIRYNLTSVARRWRSLTDEQRAAWRSTAPAFNSKTRCGTNGPLTGHQLFVKVNATNLLIGADLTTTPPATPEFPPSPFGALAITNLGGTITLKIACPSTQLENTILRASAPLSPGIGICKDFRILGLVPAATQGACNITTLYTARYGVPAVGQRIYIRTNQMIDGLEDYNKNTSALVPAAS